MRDAERPFDGGGRFEITVANGAVIKRGDPRALARDAGGLRHAAGLDIAPRLIASRRGLLVTELLDGAARPLEAMRPHDARALGQAVRHLHEARRTRTGGRPEWTSRVRSLAAYRRRRVDDAIAAAGPDRALAERVVASLAPLAAPAVRQPFRFLHGDLVSGNVIWGPAPRLVDFEFWRMGDPAEDLAYLIAVNALPPALVRGVLDGYGHAGAAARVDAWLALCALDAGLWYRNASQPERADELIARAAHLAARPLSG